MRERIPNLLTMARVLMVPAFVAALGVADGSDGRLPVLVALALFCSAVATDWLDGLLARRWNVVTRFGKLVDPLADKLLTMTAFVMFVDLAWLSGWIVIIILAREIAINSLRMIAALDEVVIQAGQGGKMKTVLQFFGIFILLLHPTLPAELNLLQIGRVLVYLSAVMSWISAIQYFRAYFASETTDETT